jgi:hypothetical protein
MVTVTDFRKVVSEYLSRSIDRSVFTKRFAELFYNIEKCGDGPSIELGNAIEARLAEAISGLISENDLRDALTLLSLDVCVFPEFRADSAFRVVTERDNSSSPYTSAGMVLVS